MKSRERFIKTMKGQNPDRPPLFEDGLRDNVLKNWRSQGLGKRSKLNEMLVFDIREEFEPNLDPLPAPKRWPKTQRGLRNLSKRLNAEDAKRFPKDWARKLTEWKKRDYPLILRVHNGYFLTLGVHGWHRFSEAIELLVDDPGFVDAWMDIYAQFTAQLVDKILGEVVVDAVLFSEPIGGNHGPLISPKMYAAYVLKNYQPILDVVLKHGISTIIYRTYANTRVLLPSVIMAGFNCLWACETEPQAMDYIQLRKEFGRDLRLIGGIDVDCLRQNKHEILAAVMGTVPVLLEEGGYIPLADGRVREEVTFENYLYYRNLLESITGGIHR